MISCPHLYLERLPVNGRCRLYETDAKHDILKLFGCIRWYARNSRIRPAMVAPACASTRNHPISFYMSIVSFTTGKQIFVSVP